MAMQANSRPWMILNYAVSEPNEWTCRAIAEDLGDTPKKIGMAVRSLKQRGFVVEGEKIGRAHALFPTPKGVQALYEAI